MNAAKKEIAQICICFLMKAAALKKTFVIQKMNKS